MNFKNGKSIAAIAICFTLGTNMVSYASTATSVKDYKSVNHSEGKIGFSKKADMPGILEKLGITKQELEDGVKAGKTLFDIAKEKGHSESEVRNIMIEEKNKYIDSEVQKGTLTKEKADEIKTKFKERMQKWDGRLKDSKCNHRMHEEKDNNKVEDKDDKAD
jgi:hypothetical protein